MIDSPLFLRRYSKKFEKIMQDSPRNDDPSVVTPALTENRPVDEAIDAEAQTSPGFTSTSTSQAQAPLTPTRIPPPHDESDPSAFDAMLVLSSDALPTAAPKSTEEDDKTDDIGPALSFALRTTDNLQLLRQKPRTDRSAFSPDTVSRTVTFSIQDRQGLKHKQPQSRELQFEIDEADSVDVIAFLGLGAVNRISTQAALEVQVPVDQRAVQAHGREAHLNKGIGGKSVAGQELGRVDLNDAVRHPVGVAGASHVSTSYVPHKAAAVDERPTAKARRRVESTAGRATTGKVIQDIPPLQYASRDPGDDVPRRSENTEARQSNEAVGRTKRDQRRQDQNTPESLPIRRDPLTVLPPNIDDDSFRSNGCRTFDLRLFRQLNNTNKQPTEADGRHASSDPGKASDPVRSFSAPWVPRPRRPIHLVHPGLPEPRQVPVRPLVAPPTRTKEVPLWSGSLHKDIRKQPADADAGKREPVCPEPRRYDPVRPTSIPSRLAPRDSSCPPAARRSAPDARLLRDGRKRSADVDVGKRETACRVGKTVNPVRPAFQPPRPVSPVDSIPSRLPFHLSPDPHVGSAVVESRPMNRMAFFIPDFCASERSVSPSSSCTSPDLPSLPSTSDWKFLYTEDELEPNDARCVHEIPLPRTAVKLEAPVTGPSRPTASGGSAGVALLQRARGTQGWIADVRAERVTREAAVAARDGTVKAVKEARTKGREERDKEKGGEMERQLHAANSKERAERERERVEVAERKGVVATQEEEFRETWKAREAREAEIEATERVMHKRRMERWEENRAGGGKRGCGGALPVYSITCAPGFQGEVERGSKRGFHQKVGAPSNTPSGLRKWYGTLVPVS